MTLGLTSCFEIIEDITIHTDGSGKVKFIINASQSRTDINTLLILKEVNGYSVPSINQIQSKLNTFTDSVRRSEGFSNVYSTFDSNNYIITFTAEFDKVERLNNGIFNLWNRYDQNNAIREDYFTFSQNKFYRQSGQLFNILYKKLKGADRKVLNEATYTSLYRFDQVISSQENPLAKTSKNGKVVFFENSNSNTHKSGHLLE